MKRIEPKKPESTKMVTETRKPVKLKKDEETMIRESAYLLSKVHP